MTGIQTYVDDYGTKRVKAVETNKGTIRTNTVVNAAGKVTIDFEINFYSTSNATPIYVVL